MKGNNHKNTISGSNSDRNINKMFRLKIFLFNATILT